jgi:hypothetical protein
MRFRLDPQHDELRQGIRRLLAGPQALLEDWARVVEDTAIPTPAVRAV